MNDPRTDRIAALIAAYGANRARWPEAGRTALEPREEDLAAADWREARELDAWLDALDAPPPRVGLRREILLAVSREPRGARGWFAAWRELWHELGGTRIAAPALVLALGVGLGLDWATTPAFVADAAPEDLLTLVQFDDTLTDLDP